MQNIIPMPQRLELVPTTSDVPQRLILMPTNVASPDRDAVLRAAAVILAPWIDDHRAETSAVSASRALELRLSIDPQPQRSELEAYQLTIGQDGALISAAGVAGMCRGLQTLRQVLEDAAEAGRLAHLRIADWPRLASRGIHYDLARETAYRHAHMRRVVERLAYAKLNTLHLYLEHRFAYPSLAGAGVTPNEVMTPDDARCLCEHARALGVTIIPQIPTLGHMGGFLHGELAELREFPNSAGNICPTHPRTRPLLGGMIADVADAFRPPFIHVGYDESHAGVCERCRRRGTPEHLLAEHLNFLNAEVKRHGARTMIYGDKFLSPEDFPRADAVNGATSAQAAAALAAIDRDILITDWHYTAPYANTTPHLIAQGFEVHTCCATNMYWHDALPLFRGSHWIVESLEQGIAAGVTGTYNANWEHYRGQCFDNHWYFQLLTAERLWSNHPHDYATFPHRFARRLYGIDGDAFVEMAGLAETVQSNRKMSFLDGHVLAIDIPYALNQMWPSWRQAAFDFTETGEYLIRCAERLRARAKRNADTLRLMDMPGQVVRYLGVRAHQRVLLEAALTRGDRGSALAATAAIRDAANRIENRLREAYDAYGHAVIDRERLAEHIRQLDAIEQRLSDSDNLDSLTIESLISMTREP